MYFRYIPGIDYVCARYGIPRSTILDVARSRVLALPEQIDDALNSCKIVREIQLYTTCTCGCNNS